MKKFFKQPSKVALTTLIITITLTILHICIISLIGVDLKIVPKIAFAFMEITTPFLIISPLVGFIYSFFIKGKLKILYIILHLACICTISVFAFLAIMFRYFVPFAP
ncbi:hypothetical protein D4N35_016040 [Siminovitchia fortis]|uniref:Uncharacterized protein n=1 Tax=Siminovitchia fortis TaxID=254758 RepID=A0A443IK12_9BACI|nr:hypothetical protein D4N35_016040 [Siminovitchia fortis]